MSRSIKETAFGLVAFAAAATAGPCDIYASGNVPCVAAHSTTRALYNNYSGPLYSVIRNSDGQSTIISPLSAGGVANSAVQDNFCIGTTCVIHQIYDQSGHNNHLTPAPPGGAASGPQPGGYDNSAAAFGAPVTLNGHKAYGVFISPGTGYRNDATTNIATGDNAEGLYAVFDGTHWNSGCCFDYGNAEVSAHDTGNGHMEAIYFGTEPGYGYGSGSGPWIMADLENGLFAGQPGYNPNDPTQTSRFITAIVKGEPNNWAIKGGNAQSGGLNTYYSGTRPSGSVSGYNPMSKEGAIILGIGGDNSDASQGTFYEGVMTTGYPADYIENNVQANIVAAGYQTTSLTSGPSVNVGSIVTLQVTTSGLTNRYIAHTGATVNTQVITSSSSSSLQDSGRWHVVTGLGNSACVSFESVDTPGSYLRHYNFQIMLNANDGSKLFSEDATYCPQAGLDGQGNSIRSWSYPTRYFRHYNAIVYAASQGGPESFDNPNIYTQDVSFIVGGGFQN